MSIIRQHLKQRLTRARISRYERHVVVENIRTRNAVEHVQRSASVRLDYI